ncbi:hypothetical protein G7046_g6975 [Stylonectria norvegica]|nr:hypothetical protein G7046_g6975 [Stylonectria norvegica]
MEDIIVYGCDNTGGSDTPEISTPPEVGPEVGPEVAVTPGTPNRINIIELGKETMAPGLILLYVAVSNDEALPRWHAELQKIPGMVTVRKLIATDIVDLSRPYRDSYDVEVTDTKLITEEVLKLLMAAAGSAISRWDAHVYSQISAEAKENIDLKAYPPTNTELIQVGMSPTPESTQDYHAWFDEEHLEMLADVPGWRTGHRFEWIRSAGNGDETASPFMSAHTYAEVSGLGGDIWRKSIETPWTKKVLANLNAPTHRRAWKFVPLNFLGLIDDIAEVTANHEHQNRAYCWFRKHPSLSKLTGTWICGFECYESEAALAEVHRSSREYQAMRTAVVNENLMMRNSPLPFSQPAAEWGFLNSSNGPMIHFATAKEALIVVTTYTTENHEITAALLSQLLKIADVMRGQDDVFAYYPLRRLDNDETEITVFQAYRSERAYFEATHAANGEITEANSTAEKTETTFWSRGLGHIR